MIKVNIYTDFIIPADNNGTLLAFKIWQFHRLYTPEIIRSFVDDPSPKRQASDNFIPIDALIKWFKSNGYCSKSTMYNALDQGEGIYWRKINHSVAENQPLKTWIEFFKPSRIAAVLGVKATRIQMERHEVRWGVAFWRYLGAIGRRKLRGRYSRASLAQRTGVAPSTQRYREHRGLAPYEVGKPAYANWNDAFAPEWRGYVNHYGLPGGYRNNGWFLFENLPFSPVMRRLPNTYISTGQFRVKRSVKKRSRRQGNILPTTVEAADDTSITYSERPVGMKRRKPRSLIEVRRGRRGHYRVISHEENAGEKYCNSVRRKSQKK